MREQQLFSKIARGLARDQHLGVGQMLRKGVKLLAQTTRARIALRSCSALGVGARVTGRMHVANSGSLIIGDGLSVHSTFLPVELVTGDSGRLQIGDRVVINFGSVITAKNEVRIGNDVQMGPHCIVSDVDIPEAVHTPSPTEPRPIEIGDHAWLAGRVTVRPGVKIGKGAVISAGSIVESDIPDGVLARGIPARVVRRVGNGVGSPDGLSQHNTRAADVQEIGEPARFTATLVSDFTISELADELRVASGSAGLRVNLAQFGQMTQALLLSPPAEATDFLVAWTRPESAVPAFERAMAFEDVDEAEIIAEVNAFCSLIERAALSYKFVFVPTWTMAPWSGGSGMLDGRNGRMTRLLLFMNLRLYEALAHASNVFVLNTEHWIAAAGSARNPKAWYLGKIAFPRAVMVEAASDIRATIIGLVAGARKLLIVDLDDTLWGGILGDVGREGIRLGGHDGIGAAFVDFQRTIKNLKRCGVLLGIVSNNEEHAALDAIRRHPCMVLREEDFSGWKINRTDKATSIVDLASELGVRLDSVVFIDDDPVERRHIRCALPEVLVPDLPDDKLLYPSAFVRLRCFDMLAIGRKDNERMPLRVDECKSMSSATHVGSEEWPKSPETTVSIEPRRTANPAGNPAAQKHKLT
jgi:HAD superfamily phosphatase (TIGR01681 family)